MNEPTTPLHIVELRTENVKRIRAVTVRPDGNVVIIGGRNEQGKSSLLDSIEMALGGSSTIPAEPLRRGARKGTTVLDLGELVVERSYDNKGRSKLVVKNAAGVPQKSPQTLLDQLCAKVAFDPFAFTRETPRRQDEILREAVGLDLSDLEEKRAVLYEQRRDVNREAKNWRARADGMPHHEDAPAEEVSVAELSEKLEEIRETCQENRNKREMAEMAADQVYEFEGDLETTERLIQETEERLRMLREDFKEKRLALDRAKDRAEEARASIAELVDPDPEPIRQQIATAEETNRKVRENRSRLEAEANADVLADRARELSDQIEQVDEEKAERLAAAQFPVPGLGFDETGPTLDGIPLEQCSQAQRLRLSVAIGAAINPRVKIMLIREGAFLDQDSLKLLGQLAAETGSQLWVERVGTDDASAIVIEDGNVLAQQAGAAE